LETGPRPLGTGPGLLGTGSGPLGQVPAYWEQTPAIGDRPRSIGDRSQPIGNRPRPLGTGSGPSGTAPGPSGDRPRSSGDRPRLSEDRPPPVGNRPRIIGGSGGCACEASMGRSEGRRGLSLLSIAERFWAPHHVAFAHKRPKHIPRVCQRLWDVPISGAALGVPSLPYWITVCNRFNGILYVQWNALYGMLYIEGVLL
jgi:hypothetical protein